MWQISQTQMVPPMGFSLSFKFNNKMGGSRDHLDSDPLNLTLHQRLGTRTLFVMQTSSGERFKLFTKYLAPNTSTNLNTLFSIALFQCVFCCWFLFFSFMGLVNLFMGVSICVLFGVFLFSPPHGQLSFLADGEKWNYENCLFCIEFRVLKLAWLVNDHENCHVSAFCYAVKTCPGSVGRAIGKNVVNWFSWCFGLWSGWL